MSIKGSPRTWFDAALKRGDLTTAWGEAFELRPLTLADSLGLLLLMAEERDARYYRGAARWLGRFALDRKVDVDELAAAATGLAVLPRAPEPARAALARICERHEIEVIGLRG